MVLYRGDRKVGVTAPDPAAPVKLVRHILYLEGPVPKKELPDVLRERERERTL